MKKALPLVTCLGLLGHATVVYGAQVMTIDECGILAQEALQNESSPVRHAMQNLTGAAVTVYYTPATKCYVQLDSQIAFSTTDSNHILSNVNIRGHELWEYERRSHHWHEVGSTSATISTAKPQNSAAPGQSQEPVYSAGLTHGNDRVPKAGLEGYNDVNIYLEDLLSDSSEKEIFNWGASTP